MDANDAERSLSPIVHFGRRKSTAIGFAIAGQGGS
jgi:hypothetical protein